MSVIKRAKRAQRGVKIEVEIEAKEIVGKEIVGKEIVGKEIVGKRVLDRFMWGTMLRGLVIKPHFTSSTPASVQGFVLINCC